MPSRPLPPSDLEHVLAHTRPLWEEMRGRRIFLTGGTGFFGTWLVESFSHVNRSLDLGARMVVLSRDPRRLLAKCPHIAHEPAISFHAGDVRTFDFPDGAFHCLVHAATDTSARTAAGAPDEIFSSIVEGTRHVLDFAARCGSAKLLLTSSGAVYGKQPSNLPAVSEDYTGAPDPMDPASAYGEGKRAAELLCALHSRNSQLQCKIARCWAFCGPHLALDQHFAIGNFIGDVLANRPIHVRGDGTPRRSYLYAADLALWLWTILFRAPNLRPYNVGGATDVSIGELARTVVSTLGSSVPIEVAGVPMPDVLATRYVPDIGRASRELGLTPSVNLTDMIQRTASWYGLCR